jgi:hypothetical protein
MMTASDITAFWEKVDRSSGAESCWPWTAGKTTGGYGQHRNGGCHRIAWELVNGPIPNKLCVLHACDNPPCCNPAHLFLGTRRDNALDAADKGHKKHGYRRPATIPGQGNNLKYTVMFTVLLAPEQHADLAAAAAAEDTSMGEIVRAAIDAYLRTLGPVTPTTPQEAE